MPAEWTAQDERNAQLINQYLGPVRVLSHEETRMTETAPEDFTGDGDNEWAQATAIPAQPATYPEYSYSLADHVYTWSPKLPDGSMLVFRSQTADGLVEAVENMAPLAARLKAAWQGVVGQPQAAPAPQGGFQPQAATPPPFGPNVSVPAAPGYQGPPVQQAPQWGAPQGGGFNGGQQGGQGNKPQPKPQPNGWYKTDKNTGQGADFWKSWREANQTALKGKISWGGGSTFWVSPDIAQMVHNAGFAVVAA